MLHARSLFTAAAVGVLGGALFALWATLAEAQGSPRLPALRGQATASRAAPGRSAAAP